LGIVVFLGLGICVMVGFRSLHPFVFALLLLGWGECLNFGTPSSEAVGWIFVWTMWLGFPGLGVWAWRKNSWLLAAVFDVLLIVSAVLAIRGLAQAIQGMLKIPYG